MKQVSTFEAAQVSHSSDYNVIDGDGEAYIVCPDAIPLDGCSGELALTADNRGECDMRAFG